MHAGAQHLVGGGDAGVAQLLGGEPRLHQSRALLHPARLHPAPSACLARFATGSHLQSRMEVARQAIAIGRKVRSTGQAFTVRARQ